MHDVHDVVVGHHAHDVAFVVHDGHGKIIVVRQKIGHFALVHVIRHGDHALARHGIAHDGPGTRQHQVAQRKHPHQFVVLVHHIGVVGAFLVLHLAADVSDGLVGRHVLFQQDQLGVHDTGRGVGVEVQQVAQLFGIFARQLAQQDVAVFLVQLVQHVGGVVGLHLGDDLGGHVGIQVLQHVHGHAAFQFGQGLGGVLRGHVAQGADLLFQTQVLQMVGKVGGMDEFRLVPQLAAGLGYAYAMSFRHPVVFGDRVRHLRPVVCGLDLLLFTHGNQLPRLYACRAPACPTDFSHNTAVSYSILVTKRMLFCCAVVKKLSNLTRPNGPFITM